MNSCFLIFGVFLLFFSYEFASAIETEVFDDNNFENEPFQEHKMALISGSHLRIAISWFPGSHMVLKRDENDRIVKVGGISGLTLEYLASSLHFTFEYVYENDFPTNLEDLGTQKPGMITKFINSNCDVMLGQFGYTPNRYKIIGYTLPTSFSSMALLIPKPTMQKTNHALAVVEPFQPKVWLFVGISLIVGVTSLYWVWRGISCFKRHSNSDEKEKNDSILNETNRFGRAIDFIFGLIVIQGSFAGGALGNDNKLLAIRFLTGAWCLTCFVLVTAYSSVLVSFMTASDTFKPIVDSINDLAIKRDVLVTVDKGLIVDVIFQNAVGDDKPEGIFKFIGEELKRHPEQRCTSTDKCIDRVREGSSVYIYPENYILNMIGADWKKTGKCDFTIAKERFMVAVGTVLLLKKNNPYTEQFSREIAKLQSIGLLPLWLNDNGIDPTYCLKKIDQEMNPKKSGDLKPLTLMNLSGAFIILEVGYALGIAAFIVEVVHGRMNKKNHKKIIEIQGAAKSVGKSENAITTRHNNSTTTINRLPHINAPSLVARAVKKPAEHIVAFVDIEF